MNRRSLLSLLAVSTVLGGCSTFKKLTGQSNDTVLPGQREEILTPDQYTAKSEDLNPPAGDGATPPPTPAPAQQQTSEPASECDPGTDPDCVPPPKKSVNKGIFNDG